MRYKVNGVQELLAQLPNGEVREEDLEGLVRWATC